MANQRPAGSTGHDLTGADRSAPGSPLPAGLYIVSTPIGNLGDITLRALQVLRDCTLIASEDTRTTIKLLSHFDIHTPLTSYHQHSAGRKAQDLVRRIQKGESIALVSEAGTPGISDPGSDLVRMCVEAGCLVTALPGACAMVHFLACAGLNSTSFVFLGFPPRKPGDRARFFQGLSSETRTMVLYESPNRVRPTLAAISRAMPGRQVSLGRELTKMHEEFWRGSIEDALEEFTLRRPRGEFVLGLAGAEPVSPESVDLEEEYRRLASEGLSDKDAIAALARRSGLPRREVYAAVVKWKGSSRDAS